MSNAYSQLVHSYIGLINYYVAVVTLLWFIIRFTLNVILYLWYFYYNVVIDLVMIVLILFFSVRHYESKPIAHSIVIIPIALAIQYFLYYVPFLSPLVIGLYLYAAVNLGFTLKDSLTSRTTSTIPLFVVSLILILAGGIGLIIRLPTIAALFYGFPVFFGLYDVVFGMLTIFIVLGATSIELPSTPLYWIFFFGFIVAGR